jgi:hypothetical protein
MNPQLSSTDRRAAESKDARDQLRDILELLGLDIRVDLIPGRHAVRLAELPIGDAKDLAEALLAGAMSRRLILTPGAPVWSMRNRGVGVITKVARHHVDLKSLSSGERWHSSATDLRAATLNEINAAREGAARDTEAPV